MAKENDGADSKSTLEITEVVEKVHAGTYSNIGIMYNYEMHPKDKPFLEYYFSLPPIRQFVEELQKRPTPQMILDLGSGIGLESKQLKDLLPSGKVFSSDISTVGTESGKEVFGLTQVQADAVCPPFAGNQFDGIHCKDVLIHIADKDALIENISRILKPNGLLIVISAEEAYEAYKQFKWDPEELKVMAKKYGLELVSQDAIFFGQDDWYTINRTRVLMIFKKTHGTE